MKASNVLALEKYCKFHDDFICFTKDNHDDCLTCEKCIYGNELVETLLDKITELEKMFGHLDKAFGGS